MSEQDGFHVLGRHNPAEGTMHGYSVSAARLGHTTEDGRPAAPGHPLPEPNWARLRTLNEYLCPCCYEHVYTQPLRRPGTYRLIDADGHGHLQVCAELRMRPASTAFYRPNRGVA